MNYTLENITYVDTGDNVSAPFGRGNGSPILNTETVKDIAALTENEWATYGVKKVASAAALPAVLFAQNVSTMSVTLTDDLAANLYADFAIANEAYEGDDIVVTKVGDEYRISYVDILPQQIGDDIVIDLGTAGKKTVCIKDYLIALLSDANAKHVAADLLRYGAAAQTYSGYKTTALVTAGLDLNGLGTTFTSVTATNPVKGTNVTQIALRLDNSLALVGNDGTTVSVNATDMDTVKTVGDAQCSVAAYVKWALSETSGLEQAQKDLIRAIYAYGLSAKAYAN